MSYAENTSVSAERSRAELETILGKYGADAFGYMTDKMGSQIVFKCSGRSIRIRIPKADGSELKQKTGPWSREVTDTQRTAYAEKENRRRWRSLVLVVKAKLEAVESGIAVFDDEFLAYTVTPNGETVGEWMAPQLAEMKLGKMPLMLGSGRNSGQA